jgi:hypothetical protein
MSVKESAASRANMHLRSVLIICVLIIIVMGSSVLVTSVVVIDVLVIACHECCKRVPRIQHKHYVSVT